MQHYSRPKGDFQDRGERVPIDTHAEIYYYRKQINSRNLMVIVFADGEEVEGTIEWYDRDALKVNRTDGPNLLIHLEEGVPPRGEQGVRAGWGP